MQHGNFFLFNNLLMVTLYYKVQFPLLANFCLNKLLIFSLLIAKERQNDVHGLNFVIKLTEFESWDFVSYKK